MCIEVNKILLFLLYILNINIDELLNIIPVDLLTEKGMIPDPLYILQPLLRIPIHQLSN